MRIKKVLQGTALMALAAAAWLGTGTVDASATTSPSPSPSTPTAAPAQSTNISAGDIELDFSGSPFMKVTIPNKNIHEIMFGVATGKETTGFKIADGAWDVYDVSGKKDITIDLSKLSITKDNFVAVKSELSNDTIFIKIAGSYKGQTIKYKPVEKELTITNEKKVNNNSDIPDAKWEYRTAYGNWKSLDKTTDVFEEYQYQGASLYVRRKATTAAALSAQTASTIKDISAGGNNAAERKLYLGGYMPGKESKVNIPAMAKGPSISVNYLNGTVKLKNNTQYRVIASGGSIEKTLDASTGDKTVEELLGTATSGTLEVRKSATTTKSASKWNRVEIKVPNAIKLGSDVKGGKIDVPTSSAVEIAEGVTIKALTKNKSSKDKTQVYSGKCEVKNNSTTDDITVQVKGATRSDKIGHEGKKNITLKDTDKVIITINGNKSKKVWVSKPSTEIELNIND